MDQQRAENDQEAKEIEYDNEQRKIMDSFEKLLRSKDITIKSMENKLENIEERIKNRIKFKNEEMKDGVVMLKSKQMLLSKEIIKNVQDSLIKCSSDPNTNSALGKMNITKILFYLNQNLFSNAFNGEEISYKELHPLSNEIFSLFIEKKFPNSFNDSDTTPGGHKKRNSFVSGYGKLDIDEISI